MRKSVNNIYKIPAKGGQPVQVTRHTDGSLFWPSMSSDGKVIVYEDNFGIWKLDVASGKTSEIKLDIATDEKENEVELETITNEVDTFDLSPSGRRAVISARGQILTIATERGDITRVAPDQMASRNQLPKWSADGKYIAFVSDRSGRDEIWISDPEGRDAEEDHRPRQREGRARLDAGLDGAPLHRRRQEALQLQRRRRQDGRRRLERRRPHRLGRRCRPTASGSRSRSRIARCARTSTSCRSRGGEERHVSDDSLLYSETNAVWTADGRYLVFTSSEGFSNGIASQGGISATMELWALSLRDQDRDPTNRDIDNEAQGLAAEAAARQNTGAAAAARPARAAGGAHRLERPARGARGS